MADQQQASGEVVERAVELVPRIDVEVVGRFVEQQYVGPLQQLRGQPERDDLTAGQRAQPPVQREVRQAEPVQLRADPLLDIPVVADRGEDLLAGVSGSQRGERVDDGA